MKKSKRVRNTTILVTGSQGFIGSYLCQEFLNAGYKVIGVDNYSKYGKIARPHDKHKNFTFFEWDVSKLKIDKLSVLWKNIDYIVAGHQG